MDLTNQGQFINFLFKCLDKHQREASILFLNLDLENEHFEVLTRLITFYSNVFDFNFINSKYLAKSASNVISEMNKLKTEYTNKLNDIKTSNSRQTEFFISAQNSFIEQNKYLLNSNRSLENRLQNLERKLS